MSERREQLRGFYATEMKDRASRPLGEDRERHLTEFVRECRLRGLTRVVEVGCGAGRDGTVIRDAGLAFQGLDLSAEAVRICVGLDLEAVEGLATDLPFADASFDAGWSMRTLMHLEGDEIVTALSELSRVVRSGGMIEVGVWGHVHDGEHTAADGRYFRHRTDEAFQDLMSAVGAVEAFETWDWQADDAHYQWARVVVR